MMRCMAPMPWAACLHKGYDADRGAEVIAWAKASLDKSAQHERLLG